MRLRRVLVRAVLVLVAGLAGLFICEIALRLQEPYFHLMERKYNYTAFIVSNPIWDHSLRPQTTLSFRWLGPVGSPQPVVYTTNREGCRYPRDPLIPKPRDVRRILVLGDSFTLGYFFEDTLAAQLERRLNSQSQARHYEVVNCASPSHSPLLYYLRLKNQLVTLQPDELILNIDPTDVFDDYWRYRPRCQFAPDGDPVAVSGSVRWTRRILEWALGRSYLARAVWAFRSTLNLPRGGRDVPADAKIFAYYSTLPVESPSWQKEVGFCLENISRILNFCREQGIVATVTMVPHEQQLRPDARGRLWNREFDRRVERLCRDAGVSFYSPAEGLARAINAGQTLYRENDMHFTVEGERLWSGLLADFYTAREGARLERAKLAHSSTAAP